MADEVQVNGIRGPKAPSPDGSLEELEDVRSRTEEDVDEGAQPEKSEAERIKAEYEERLKGMQSGFNKKVEELQAQLRQNDERAAMQQQKQLEESWASRIQNARSDNERTMLKAQYAEERARTAEQQYRQMLANQQVAENMKKAKSFIAETTGVDTSLLDDVGDVDEAWLRGVTRMKEQYDEMAAELERMKHANVSVGTSKAKEQAPKESEADAALKKGDMQAYFAAKLKEARRPQ